MKKGDEVWVRWSGDDSLQQCRITGISTNGYRVVWLTGPLKERDALIEKETMKQMAE